MGVLTVMAPDESASRPESNASALGARVAICVDGSNSNNGQNLWQAMKLAIYLQRAQSGDRYLGTAEQALELATIKAAAALDMNSVIIVVRINKPIMIAHGPYPPTSSMI